MVRNLGASSSVVSQYLSELRDVNVQGDRQRFRRNMERLGEIFAYELSKELPNATRAVSTPLGTAQSPVPSEWPVLITDRPLVFLGGDRQREHFCTSW